MSGQTGRLLAIIERGEPIPEVSRRDMRLIADTLAAQARQLLSQARSKTLAGAAVSSQPTCRFLARGGGEAVGFLI